MAPGEPHRSSSRAARRRVAAFVGAGLLVTACGNGSGAGDDDSPSLSVGAATTAETALPACRDVDRTVVFGVFGAATAGGPGEIERWTADPAAQPEARAGAAELVGAYREHSYQVLCVTPLTADTLIGEQPVVDAVTVWLGTHGFPVGDGVRVWAPAAGADPSVALIEELARMGADGTEVDAAYAGDVDTVFPLVSGGVASDEVYLLGDGEVDGTTSTGGVAATPLLDADIPAQVDDVRSLEPICR